MVAAIAAYTPNVPWARFGEPDMIDFDGAGTSAATPQVAGAAALWIQKYRSEYGAYAERCKGWRRCGMLCSEEPPLILSARPI